MTINETTIDAAWDRLARINAARKALAALDGDPLTEDTAGLVSAAAAALFTAERETEQAIGEFEEREALVGDAA